MNQLVTVVIPPASALVTIADTELAAARSFAEMEKSAGSRRAYRSDFAIFTAWCDARGAAGYGVRLPGERGEGRRQGQHDRRRAAAIRYAHRPWPDMSHRPAPKPSGPSSGVSDAASARRRSERRLRPPTW
jgi:hypothetical protein